MAERRAGLGRGLGELFQRTDPDAPSHPVDEHVIIGGSNHHDHGKTSDARVEEPRVVSRETPTVPRKVPAEELAATPGVGSTATALAERDVPAERATVDPANGYYAEIPIGQIHPNTRQPRSVFEEESLTELVGSIQEVGLLQPIVVRRSGLDAYELVMGERRWRASGLAGLESVPAIVRSTADDDMLRDALLENIHRVQLNPLEEAAAYQQLMEDFGCTQQVLAEKIKRSRSQIANTVRLLNLPPTVQRQVAAGALSAGHARALLGLSDVKGQERLAQRIMAEGLSVRATEEIVASGSRHRSTPKPRTPRGSDPSLRLLSTELESHLDTRVEVTRGRKKGRIVVEFATDDDLQRIVRLLSR